MLPQPWTRQEDSQERIPACLVQFISVVPDGVTSCSSPGQPLSRRMDAGVSTTSEDEGAALGQGCVLISDSVFQSLGLLTCCLWMCWGFGSIIFGEQIKS